MRRKKQPRIRSSAQGPVDGSRPLALRDMIRSKRLSFAIAFTFFCIALYAFIQVCCRHPLQSQSTRIPLLHWAWALNTLGIPVSTADDTVTEGGLAFRIIPECTPIFTAGLFLSFVVFIPPHFDKRRRDCSWASQHCTWATWPDWPRHS